MNEHIKEYLEDYVNLNNPQYAVLITGKWGCGKTYFIKQLIEQWGISDEKSDSGNNIVIKPIYVSLNGISDVNVIHENIKAAISPFLYSKGMQIIKEVGKGFLRGALKVDFDYSGDAKSDGNLSFNIDPTSIFNAKSEDIKGKRLLIFDDLERLKLPIDEIFGYINNFLEHSECKIILIADEERLIEREKEKKKDENTKDYRHFKEKLIGQTFTLQTDFDKTIEHFINEAHEVNIKIDFASYKDLIKDIFQDYGLGNLRLLRRSLCDFARFSKLIDENITQKDSYPEYEKNLLSYFLILFMEHNYGNTTIKDYEVLAIMEPLNNNTAKILYKPEHSPTKTKYRLFEQHEVLPYNLYVQYISTSIIDKNILNKAITECTFFRKSDLEEWEKLWYWWTLEDEEFETLSKHVINQFLNREIRSPYVLFHIYGMLFKLVDEKLIELNKEDINKKSREILEEIFSADFSRNSSFFDRYIGNVSSGKQYHSVQSEEFKHLSSFYQEIYEDYAKEFSINKFRKLFDEFSDESVISIIRVLREPLPDKRTTYDRTAIFKDINGGELGNRLITLTNKTINDFDNFLHYRYYPKLRDSNGALESYHKDDLNCLISMKLELENYNEADQPIKMIAIRKLIISLEDIIVKINGIPDDNHNAEVLT